MKKILFPLLTLLLALFIAGCSVGNPSNDATIPEYEDPEFGVSTQQLIEDITENETIADCLSSKFIEVSPIEYVSHEITKRKIDEDKQTDVIFCSINVKEDYIAAKIDAKLNYNFYDVGGWVLDAVSIEDYTLSPLKAANADMIINDAKSLLSQKYDHYGLSQNLPTSQWFNKFFLYNDITHVTTDCDQEAIQLSVYASDFKIISCNLNNTMGNITQLCVSLNSGVMQIDGYIPLSFDEKKGWDWTAKQRFENHLEECPVIIITEQKAANTQSVLGKYKADSYILDITKIDTENQTIYYSVNNISQTAEFDPYKCEFQVYLQGIKYIEYNPITGTWQTRNYSVYHNQWVFWTFSPI